MNIEEKIYDEAIKNMKKIISEADGNEVFFKGILDDDGKVCQVEALARGNRHSAPALVKRMNREEVIIHNHPSGYLYPSDADVEVASYYANDFNGGFYIINNEVTEIYVVVNVHKEKNIAIDVAPYFEKEGTIAHYFKEFEYREEQLLMVNAIQEGFNNEEKVVVEAGTGTGKTLAYLIPGIEWAVKNKKRIVFSTNTINLQEQLLNKDIPLAKKVLGYDFKYLLIKGRGNYLCNRKYYNFIQGDRSNLEDLTVVQKNHINEVIKWGELTKTGDKSELSFEIEPHIWENFQSETDICAKNRCPYKKECFFFKVRDEKKNADVLITNHHLYFTDLALRKEMGFNAESPLLPEYSSIVFDEAHNIEKVAREYFSSEVSKMAFIKLLNKIEVCEGKRKNNGVLVLVNKICSDLKNDEAQILINNLREKHTFFYKETKKYFDSIIDSFTVEKQETVSIRIKKNSTEYINQLDRLSSTTREYLAAYSEYQKISRQLRRLLRELDDATGHINEIIKYLERLDDSIATLKFIDQRAEDEYIYWIDINRKRGLVKRVATPLKIDTELEKNLFINIKTIIFTSATIAVGKSFKYFKESIGLKEKVVEEVIHSPFNYEKQMKVYIPKDICDPNLREFNFEVSKFLKDILISTEGKAFVLFTSYSLLNFVYYSLRDELLSEGIDLFIHGTLPRTQLITAYKNSNKPVLFGTDSFWEGVDIKGEKLSTVIIVKLPFKVPNDPVTEAIIESIEMKGKNSFTDYQIPEAVIKFKQGIGRLIRSKKDSGNIFILDNRVITKKYGEFFKEALPVRKISLFNKKEIFDMLKV